MLSFEFRFFLLRRIRSDLHCVCVYVCVCISARVCVGLLSFKGSSLLWHRIPSAQTRSVYAGEAHRFPLESHNSFLFEPSVI